jgi:cytochrome c oxidase cbb3-type subunit 3
MNCQPELRKIFLIPAAAALSVALFAQDPDDVRNQQANSSSLQQGKMQFQQNCGFCHGLDARGASGPDLIRSALVSHDQDGNLIGPVIRNGRPAKGMPSFQLSDSEIKNISGFLHAEASSAASVAKRIPSEYRVEKLLVGNADDGHAYFAAHCSGCHSASGDLSHIASKYTPFDLQTRIVFPGGTKSTLIVRDASGTVFQGEEFYSDEFFVTLRDSNRWLHTWQRKDVQIDISNPLAGHEKLLKTYSDKNIHDLFAYLETLK